MQFKTSRTENSVIKTKSLLFYPFLKRKMLVMSFLGFSSGLPLPLSSGTLQAYLSIFGVDIKTIGIFGLVGLPYTLKFLWAPIFDRFSVPILSRRRGWILLTQIVLAILIFIFPFIDPKAKLRLLGIIAVLLAFISASQDIVVDAYRTDSLKEEERGPGVSLFIMGYRVAMLMAGAGALVLSERIGWQMTYACLSLMMVVGILGTLAGKEEQLSVQICEIKDLVVKPLSAILRREKSLLMLALVILYKLGDAYLGAMTIPFLIRGCGFSPTEVGTIGKAMGILFTIVGAFFGGAIMVRWSLWKALFYFGVLQLVSNFGFVALSIYGKSLTLLVLCVAFENLSGGMGTSAFIAFLMSLCDRAYSATQFALLSSISALGRVIISPSSGFVVDYAGWVPFFIISAAFALPGLFILFIVKDHLGKGEAKLPLQKSS